MNSINEEKLNESEYTNYGFYCRKERLELKGAFLFDRIDDDTLSVKSYMITDKCFVINGENGAGRYFESKLKDVEFKGIDKNGDLVNIENWVLNKAIEINGASNFLGH